jgi:hypothetical protein
MALAHARPALWEGRVYEWVARRRGNTLRVVVQDRADRGQLLVVLLPVFNIYVSGAKGGDFYARTEVNPQSVGRWVAEGLAAGWQPTAQGLPPLQVDPEARARREFPQPWGTTGIAREAVEDLWSVLPVILRDPCWRERLLGAFGRAHPLLLADLRKIDPALAARIAGRGEVDVYLRQWDSYGNTDPYLAIKLRGTWLEVLHEASTWYKERTGEKRARS